MVCVACQVVLCKRGAAFSRSLHSGRHAFWIKVWLLPAPEIELREHQQVAGLPSREDYGLLRLLLSTPLEPQLDEMLGSESAWSTVALHGVMGR